jgi:hypothetical protein
MASKKMRKLAILAKLETVYGTDPTPTGAANAMVVHDVEITPLDGEEVERTNVQPHFGHNGAITATSFARIKFSVELAGSGVPGTAPKWSPLMRACSVGVTVSAGVSITYAPITENQESVTIYGNVDGVNHVMPGVRGECKLGLDAKGKPALMFEFQGLWTPLADATLPAAAYTGWVAPVAVNKANTSFSLHGTLVGMTHFDLAFGNQVEKRDTSEDDTVEIVDRKSSGSAVFEMTPVATKDWVSIAQAKTRGNLQLVHGVTAGNIITVAGTGTVELGKPTYQNQQGVQMINVPLRFVPTSAGNDEWSMVLT